MNQEDKDLLLQDLCARLPYNIAIDCRSEDSRFTCYLTTDILREIQNNTFYWEYKPYLFPISSMTVTQQNEFTKTLLVSGGGLLKVVNVTVETYDWLNKNHFDYRNLINKNLAIDCTNLNIY